MCDLQPVAAVAANLLSYHLKVLREAGLVGVRRRGRWMDYTIAADALDRLHAAVPGPGTGHLTTAASSCPPLAGRPGDYGGEVAVGVAGGVS